MKIIGLILVMLVAGCGQTSFGDQVRDTLKERGALAMDRALVNSEWLMCEAASIGSVKRRYGGSKAQAYKDLCASSSAEDIFERGEK